MNAIAPQRVENQDWDDGKEDLWEGFWANYEALKAGKMHREDEGKYKLISSPGPSQYSAFAELFSFFKTEKQLLKKKPDIFYTYDLLNNEELAARPMLAFLKNLCSPDYDAKGKKIVMASGSFWGQNLKTRTEVISYLNELSKNGAKVSIFARAQENEKGMNKIIEAVRKESCFGLKKRIPIHFIKAGQDAVQLEFPHTESSLFRLTMFLDLNEFKGKTKEGLLNFFDRLIRGVL